MASAPPAAAAPATPAAQAFEAVKGPDVELICRLVEQTGPRIRDVNGFSLLHWAVLHRTHALDLINFLVRRALRQRYPCLTADRRPRVLTWMRTETHRSKRRCTGPPRVASCRWLTVSSPRTRPPTFTRVTRSAIRRSTMPLNRVRCCRVLRAHAPRDRRVCYRTSLTPLRSVRRGTDDVLPPSEGS